jgi:hypothetical protein
MPVNKALDNAGNPATIVIHSSNAYEASTGDQRPGKLLLMHVKRFSFTAELRTS